MEGVTLVKLSRVVLMVIGCFLAVMSIAVLAQISHATYYGNHAEGFRVLAIAAAIMGVAVLCFVIRRRLSQR